MTPKTDTDQIVRTVTINATLDRVWDLVTEPGWWVPNDAPQPVDHTPGHRIVRRSEQYGSFPIEIVKIDPQTYAAFRWASTFPGDELTPGNTTLVEFQIAPLADGVEVTVTESGFDALDAPESVRTKGFEGNSEGWSEQLTSVKTRAEAA